MDQLQLGKFWLARLDAALPHSSSRIRTRLAWHLAGMSIETDEGLAALSGSSFVSNSGPALLMTDMTSEYLRSRTVR